MRREPPASDPLTWWPDNPDDFWPTPPTDPSATTPPASPPGPMPAFPPFGPSTLPHAHDYLADEELPQRAPVRSRRARRRQATVRIVAPILLLALLAGFLLVLRLPDSSAQPVITQSNAASASIQAYIIGAVRHPGVYRLHAGDRVYTLLGAAGGPTDDADLACVNLAAQVVDGEEVYIPHQNERPASGPVSCTVAKVNINTTSANDLHLLLGISLTTAEKIVAYRNAHGPFTSIQQLIPVVGLTIYNRIKDMVSI
jgi:competence ComEA-like helix-hairpin-helix protein